MEHQSVLLGMAQLGGVATWRQLRAGATAREITAACDAGTIVRVERGRYCTPAIDAHLREAHRRKATLSHASAAAYWGLNAKHQPDRPHLIVPRHRNVHEREDVEVTWRDLPPEVHRRGVTDPLTTVIDVARTMPYDEALCIADSALRRGLVDEHDLGRAAALARGPGSARVRAVCDSADGRAANPLESCLRAIALAVPGLSVTPQRQIADPGIWALVDLADERLMIAVEAEGYEHHGTRPAFEKDCARYVDLASLGWVVLRFTWLKVMTSPEWVAARLRATVAQREHQLDLR